ncbi:NADH2 dehydrogenase [Amylostereum chailletii]|nr:NADH2 dehydrogenase [Amylostereum chailletii]
MFRLTRPLFQQVTKLTTGIYGVPVHPNPLPELAQTYQNTLARLATIPAHSVYRQGTEALTQRKLNILEAAKGNVAEVEERLEEGQLEQALMIAKDELELVDKMAEWKAWESLEEKPEPGQWEYFGKASEAST